MGHRNLKINLLLSFILIINYGVIYSTDYVSNKIGNWSTNTVWTPTGVPGIGDNVTIGHVITLTGDQSCANVTISSELRLGSNTLTVAGNFTNNNLFTAGTGTIVLSGAATADIGGTGSLSFYNLMLNSSGTKVLRKDITVTNLFTVTAGTLNALTFNISGAGGLTATGGQLQLRKLNTTLPALTGTYSITGGVINFCGAGDQTIKSTTYYNLYSSISGTKTCAGAIDLNGELIIRDASTFAANNHNISIAGDWKVNLGCTFIPGTNTVTFDGSASQAINGTVTSHTFYNVVVNLATGQTLTTGGSATALTVQDLTQTTGNFTAPATLTINGNTTLTAGTFTAGANIYTKGNWTNNGGTFTPGTNTITFNGTSGQTINGTATSQTFYNTIVNLTAGQTLNTGGSTIALTTQNLTQTTGNFTPPVTLTINGNFILTSGTFTAGININITGNWTNNGGTFIPGLLGYTVTFNGGVAQFINGTALSQMFINVTLNGVSLNTGGSTDTLTITKLTVNAGNFTGPVRLYMQGRTELNGGTYTAGSIISTVGLWINNGGTFIPGTSTVTFIGITPKTIEGTSVSQTFNNVVLNGTGVSVAGSITRLTVNNLTQTTGDFTGPTDTLNINGNYTRTSGTFIAGSNINIKGNWTDNGGAFTPGTGIVNFTGTGAQAINGTAASQTFYNVNVSKTAGQTLSVSGSTTTLTTNNFTLTTGNFTAPPTMNISSTSTANLTVASGTFTAGTNVNITGNWTNTGGTINGGTYTANFMGTVAQVIGGTIQTTFYDLIINNTAPISPQITLGRNTAVENTLTMTAGKVNLDGYTLTLGASSAVPGTLSHTSGWMYGGNLERYFATTSVAIGAPQGHFPIGSSSDYRPFWFSYSSPLSTGGSVSVSHTGVYPSYHQSVNFDDTTWGSGTRVLYLSQSYWDLALSGITGGGSSFGIRLEATGLGLINDVNDLNLTTASGNVGSYSNSGGTTSNPQVNRINLNLTDLNFIAGFNSRATRTFYFGSKSTSSPLPISLLKFDALLQENQRVALSWVTASETNNDYFTVEKSADAINFEKVMSVKGAGNSVMQLKYNATDYYPLKEQSYYRLKQTDFDGKYTYSNIVTINKTTSTALTIFPNPATDNDNIKMSIPHDLKGKEVLINVHDLQGKNILSKSIFIDNLRKDIIISEKLNSGCYVINVIFKKNIYKQLLIVK